MAKLRKSGSRKTRSKKRARRSAEFRKAVKILKAGDINVARIASELAHFANRQRRLLGDRTRLGDKTDFGSLEDGWDQRDGKDNKSGDFRDK